MNNIIEILITAALKLLWNRYGACLLISGLIGFGLFHILTEFPYWNNHHTHLDDEFNQYYEEYQDTTRTWIDEVGNTRNNEGVRFRKDNKIVINADYHFMSVRDGLIISGINDSDNEDIFLLDKGGNIVKVWKEDRNIVSYVNDDLIDYWGENHEYYYTDGTKANAFITFYLNHRDIIFIVSMIIGLTCGCLIFSYIMPKKWRIFNKGENQEIE